VVRYLMDADLDRLPWFYKRYPPSLPGVRLPRELPATTVTAVDVLAGTANVARWAEPAAAVPVAAPVRRSGTNLAALLRHVSVPCRGIRGRPVPVGGVRRRA